MKHKLTWSRGRSQGQSLRLFVRQIVFFRFVRILSGTSVVTGAFRGIRLFNTGEVIVSQRRATGSTGTPIVRYQIVNAVTGVPVTNSVTITGTRSVILPFTVPAGSFRLRITNVGSRAVAVQGAIVVF